MTSAWGKLFELLSRWKPNRDIEKHIPHAPPLTGEPSGYVEPPLPPHEGWPDADKNAPDYMPPKPPEGGGA